MLEGNTVIIPYLFICTLILSHADSAVVVLRRVDLLSVANQLLTMKRRAVSIIHAFTAYEGRLHVVSLLLLEVEEEVLLVGVVGGLRTTTTIRQVSRQAVE